MDASSSGTSEDERDNSRKISNNTDDTGCSPKISTVLPLPQIPSGESLPPILIGNTSKLKLSSFITVAPYESSSPAAGVTNMSSSTSDTLNKSSLSAGAQYKSSSTTVAPYRWHFRPDSPYRSPSTAGSPYNSPSTADLSSKLPSLTDVPYKSPSSSPRTANASTPIPHSESMSGDEKSTISSYILAPKEKDGLTEESVEAQHTNKRRRINTFNSTGSIRPKEGDTSYINHTEHDALQKAVTALYANILVILGFALPLSEVISVHISEGFFEMFYVYLFLGSLLFLLFNYIDALQTKTRRVVTELRKKSYNKNKRSEDDVDDHESISDQNFQRNEGVTNLMVHERSSIEDDEKMVHTVYGSFYLRLGTVLFGIGSLIYTGIEIGGIFEDGLLGSQDDKGPDLSICTRSLTSIVRPGLQIIFIFSQMYFIFLNQKMNVYKHKLVGRLGLMHMIATNLCIWLKVLIMETKHEINATYIEEKYKKLDMLGSGSANISSIPHLTDGHAVDLHIGDASHHIDTGNHVDVHHQTNQHMDISHLCHDKIMFKLLEDASPFLFPCTIEFSLICAAVLFIMWKNISDQHNLYKQFKMRGVIRRGVSDNESKRPEIYSVDCSHANTGLFCGIVVLVITIISLIIFFVFISHKDVHTRGVAVTVASVSELTLYSLTTLAVLLGICQMRRLFYDVTRKLELDNLLLVIAQTGVFIYATFSIIGTFFQLEEHLIAFLASFVTMIQTPLQTVFILDASCRFAYTSQQVRNKPGREVVTFLLVCNLAMWMLNTLETNRTDSHPIQAEFYGGSWAWPMITHISMPLAIFYRFHSTVCLFEIWKKSFKYKPHASPTNI